jgi:DNA polymerase III epsilon subunit-like protein
MRPFPDDVIEDEALAVNKRTREEIEQWRDPHDTYIAFKKFMGAYVDKFDKRDKFHFVAYNARFDSDHMREWFLKCGDVYFGSWFWYPPICVMDVAAFLLRPRRGELPNFKLQTVADFMGVKVDQAQCHEASYDVALCKALYFKLCDMTMKGK